MHTHCAGGVPVSSQCTLINLTLLPTHILQSNKHTIYFISYLLCSSKNNVSEKKKLSHYTPRRRLGERRHSSYSFSTSALDGGEWSALHPGRALPPVPIVQEVGWAPEPVWTRIEEKSFASAGDRTSIAWSSSP
jgi:hypothetical protein